MTETMKLCLRGAALAVTLALSAPAMAQDYPSHPITIVVPYAPGTGLDRIARGLTEPLQAQLGVPVLVENRPGAGSIVGSNYVRTTAPDGYTILFNGAAFVAGVLLQEDQVFHPIDDFTPITKVAGIPSVVVASTNAPFETFDELISYAQDNPGRLSYISSGVAAISHLSMERLIQFYELDIPVVHYQDTAQAMMDIVSGRVPLYIPSFPAAQPHLDAGSYRAIAYGATERTPLLPDVPTIGEAIGDPEFEAVSPFIFFGPAGLDPTIVERLSTEIAEAVQSPQIEELFENLGAQLDIKSGEELREEINRSYEIIYAVMEDLDLIVN